MDNSVKLVSIGHIGSGPPSGRMVHTYAGRDADGGEELWVREEESGGTAFMYDWLRSKVKGDILASSLVQRIQSDASGASLHIIKAG